jgi:four helix bundle protein
MTYAEWESEVPPEMRRDRVWNVEAYRLALFLGDLAWPDATRLLKDARTRSVADQLFRAASNISANICEGYSRSTGKARAQFYEYGLGSARETRDWYYKGRRALKTGVAEHRMKLCTSIVGLLVNMIKTERRRIRLAANGGQKLVAIEPSRL